MAEKPADQASIEDSTKATETIEHDADHPPTEATAREESANAAGKKERQQPYSNPERVKSGGERVSITLSIRIYFHLLVHSKK